MFNKLKNGNNLIFFEMEDNLHFLKMEEDLNVVN